jgi:hypothetical protein
MPGYAIVKNTCGGDHNRIFYEISNTNGTNPPCYIHNPNQQYVSAGIACNCDSIYPEQGIGIRTCTEVSGHGLRCTTSIALDDDTCVAFCDCRASAGTTNVGVGDLFDPAVNPL